MKFLLAILACITAVSLVSSQSVPKLEPVAGFGDKEMRQIFKNNLAVTEVMVVASFKESKVVESVAVGKFHTIHTLHSRFAAISPLKGEIADEFVLRHYRDEAHPTKDQGVVIPTIPVRYEFQRGAMLVHSKDDSWRKALDEPVYFLYLKKVKDDKVKELYEVVEVNEFAGPGVFEATLPWMRQYKQANKTK